MWPRKCGVQKNFPSSTTSHINVSHYKSRRLEHGEIIGSETAQTKRNERGYVLQQGSIVWVFPPVATVTHLPIAMQHVQRKRPTTFAGRNIACVFSKPAGFYGKYSRLQSHSQTPRTSHSHVSSSPTRPSFISYRSHAHPPSPTSSHLIQSCPPNSTSHLSCPYSLPLQALERSSN